jgi:hypothetical protein
MHNRLIHIGIKEKIHVNRRHYIMYLQVTFHFSVQGLSSSVSVHVVTWESASYRFIKSGIRTPVLLLLIPAPSKLKFRQRFLITTHGSLHSCSIVTFHCTKANGHPITGHESPELEWRYSSALPLTSALDRVGGPRHAPAALPPGKTRYPLYTRLGGPQSRSGRVRKISPLPGLDPRTV